MNAPVRQAPDLEDQNAAAVLRARGFPVTDIQSLARDQNPFARRTVPWKRVLAPGVSLTARTVELGDGLTNAFTLTVDLDQARCRAASSPTGFHLRDLVHDDAVAAVSGSFSYISDDPAYQPTEPCLDPATNTTPHTPDALDCTITAIANGLKITAVQPGGGADLFADTVILRAPTSVCTA